MTESRIVRAVRSPRAALRVIGALVWGRWSILVNRIMGRRVSAGRYFKLFGRLKVRGPGVVVFGENVVLHGTVTPYTHTPNARIVIGDRTMMSNTRFGCAKEITIGRYCILAESRIFDTDFHSTRADRRTNPDAPIRVAPVTIGDNVWISELAAVLPGTVIGENSVVGFGAICMREYPPNKILIGNPAKVALSLPSVSEAGDDEAPDTRGSSPAKASVEDGPLSGEG